MKKVLDGIVMGLGTLCFLGLPVGVLGLSAWLGDGVMAQLMHGVNVGHSVFYQLEAIGLMFLSSIGGIAGTLLCFSLLWMVFQALSKRANALEPMPVAISRAPERATADTVGRMNRAPRQARRG